jgi:hypothetical protein
MKASEVSEKKRIGTRDGREKMWATTFPYEGLSEVPMQTADFPRFPAIHRHAVIINRDIDGTAPFQALLLCDCSQFAVQLLLESVDRGPYTETCGNNGQNYLWHRHKRRGDQDQGALISKQNAFFRIFGAQRPPF